MGTTTAISWTDANFNPWWGCQRVSPGCEHCYAEASAKRFGHDVWGKQSERRRFGDKHWNEPLKWNAMAEAEGVRRRVFCASMADVFEDRADHEADRNRLWHLISVTPWLDWQLLTKRPENIASMVPWPPWPSNVWLGVTVEDQRRANERVPELLGHAARVRFLSCEPLLGPVHIPQWDILRPDWVIVGGESGPGHRPLNLDHARSLRDQCRAAGVAFFFKQNSGLRPGSPGPDDLEPFKEFPA